MTTPDERDLLLTFLAAQRAALCNAARGLTEEQAVATPSASSLSIGGLIKHARRAEQGWIHVRTGGRPDPFGGKRDWVEEFRVEPGETLSGLLDAYAAVARESEEIVAGLPDLDVPVELTPRYGGGQGTARWVLLHMIEEVARHAGHADVIRESIDGATADELAG